LAAGHRDFAGRIRFLHHLSLPAGESGRHQHDADPAGSERVFINKFVYKLEPIERSDVIVFRYPRDPSKSYIKRVIAVAGDQVSIEAGVVFVNGKRLREWYVPRMYEDVRSYPETVVPPHSYFVLGDHRNLSNDSRDFGAVDESFIYGKAVFGYWPMAKLGTLH
jgi:signal peptidase I